MLLYENLTRQFDIIDPARAAKTSVLIVGAGAVGSWVAFLLAKMGIEKITIYDHDEVEFVNMNSQFYSLKDVGKKKVLALSDHIKQFTDIAIEAVPDRWVAGKNRFYDVIVSAVDCMDTRKSLYEYSSTNAWLFIDARMAAEKQAVYAMNGKSLDYEKTLYTNEEAIQERCTAKATGYCAVGIASFVVWNIKNYIVGDELTKVIITDLPKKSFYLE